MVERSKGQKVKRSEGQKVKSNQQRDRGEEMNPSKVQGGGASPKWPASIAQ
jgi:hypothetical protein